MTITRKQREPDMESVGEMLHRQELVPRPSEPLATSQPLPQSSEEAIEWLRKNGAPEWQIVLLQLAQDKKHDLAPHTLKLWKVQLEGIPDDLICRAIRLHRSEWFPDADKVLKNVELIREKDVQEAGNRSWLQYKAEQKRAEEEGLLATDEDYALLRAKLREIFGDPSVKPQEKPA